MSASPSKSPHVVNPEQVLQGLHPLMLRGSLLLSAAITLATYFVISDVVNHLIAGIVAGIVGLAIAVLWWIMPLRKRRR